MGIHLRRRQPGLRRSRHRPQPRARNRNASHRHNSPAYRATLCCNRGMPSRTGNIPGLIVRSQSGFFTVQTESGMVDLSPARPPQAGQTRGRYRRGRRPGAGHLSARRDREHRIRRTAPQLPGPARPETPGRVPASHSGQPRPGSVRLRLRQSHSPPAHAGPVPGHRRKTGAAGGHRRQQDRPGGPRTGREDVRLLPAHRLSGHLCLCNTCPPRNGCQGDQPGRGGIAGAA